MLPDYEEKILKSPEYHQRLLGLEELLGRFEAGERPVLSDELRKFILEAELPDTKPAALLGLIMWHMENKAENKATPSNSVLARIFPALDAFWDLELQTKAKEVFKGLSPKKVYIALSDQMVESEELTTDDFYIGKVLSKMDFDSVGETV